MFADLHRLHMSEGYSTGSDSDDEEDGGTPAVADVPKLKRGASGDGSGGGTRKPAVPVADNKKKKKKSGKKSKKSSDGGGASAAAVVAAVEAGHVGRPAASQQQQQQQQLSSRGSKAGPPLPAAAEDVVRRRTSSAATAQQKPRTAPRVSSANSTSGPSGGGTAVAGGGPVSSSSCFSDDSGSSAAGARAAVRMDVSRPSSSSTSSFAPHMPSGFVEIGSTSNGRGLTRPMSAQAGAPAPSFAASSTPAVVPAAMEPARPTSTVGVHTGISSGGSDSSPRVGADVGNSRSGGGGLGDDDGEAQDREEDDDDGDDGVMVVGGDDDGDGVSPESRSPTRVTVRRKRGKDGAKSGKGRVVGPGHRAAAGGVSFVGSVDGGGDDDSDTVVGPTGLTRTQSMGAIPVGTTSGGGTGKGSAGGKPTPSAFSAAVPLGGGIASGGSVGGAGGGVAMTNRRRRHKAVFAADSQSDQDVS